MIGPISHRQAWFIIPLESALQEVCVNFFLYLFLSLTPAMRRGGLLLLVLTACIMSTVVHGRLPELVLTNDERKAVPVASFGFLSGGTLSLDLRDLQVTANCLRK